MKQFFDNTIMEIGKEYPPLGEDEAIRNLRTLHLKVHQASPGKKFRGEHPKHHGGVWGTFEVANDIPEEYKVGIFQQNHPLRTFIRFSNGRSLDDREPDARGMAIKVFTDAHSSDFPQNQDFLLVDNPVFFARNVQHVYEFLLSASTGVPREKLNAMFPELAGFKKVVTESPLNLSYWSQTPYQLGAGAVKYFVTPAQQTRQEQLQPAITKSANWLKDAMIERLVHAKLEVKFDFCIQPQTNAYTMPIEDPTVEWTSAPMRIGTISIPPQSFDSPEQVLLVEKSTWSPWFCLPQHRPLGGINRARKLIYAESQEMRGEANNAD